jgi:hypothetical protein
VGFYSPAFSVCTHVRKLKVKLKITRRTEFCSNELTYSNLGQRQYLGHTIHFKTVTLDETGESFFICHVNGFPKKSNGDLRTWGTISGAVRAIRKEIDKGLVSYEKGGLTPY